MTSATRQFRTICVEEDLQVLQKVLEDSGKVDFLRDTLADDMFELPKLSDIGIAREHMGKVSLLFFLAPRTLPAKIIIVRHSAKKVSVDSSRSGVIQFWRSYIHENNISPGRVIFHHKYSNNGVLQGQEKSLTEWADNMFGLIKGSLIFSKQYKAHVGREALRLLESGDLVLD